MNRQLLINDKTRLIHMFVDNKHYTTWCCAHQTLDRTELDARVDYWDQLANEFNNYKDNVYHNVYHLMFMAKKLVMHLGKELLVIN
jgi:hypothetical protein